MVFIFNNMGQVPLTASWEQQLNSQGIRLTKSRRVVMDIIANSSKALTPLEIYDLARQYSPNLGLVTVYRTLEILERQDLIKRIHQSGNCHTVLPTVQGHQHVLICSRCGNATHFEGEDLNSLLKRVAEQSGYQIEDHWLQLFGICPACHDDENISLESNIQENE